MKNHQSENNLWNYIEELMSREGMRLNEIAQIAGVVPSAVAKWKTGSEIGFDKLSRIANHFSESLDSFANHRNKQSLRVMLQLILMHKTREDLAAELGLQPAEIDRQLGAVNAPPLTPDQLQKIENLYRATQGQPPLPSPPAAADPGDMPARLAAVEATLAKMTAQLETVVGLLGAAVGKTISKHPPAENKKKAG